MEAELFDWEMIHGSDTESTDPITSEKNSGCSSVIDDGMMILSDHFSVDDKITDPIQHDVLDSFRFDYGSESLNQRHNPVSDFEAVDEREDVAELTGRKEIEDASKCLFESDNLEVANGKCVEDSSKSWPNSVGDELVSGDCEIVNGEEEIFSESEVLSEGNGGNNVEVVAVDSAVRSGDESKSREIVWWKMPFVLLKYCAFRIGPVCSISMAAAVMGLVLLRRRLYNMRKKDQRFHLKFTIDDKKASQVMSQAARLNEMFREVRRVPVIRPALPSPGAWPALTLR